MPSDSNSRRPTTARLKPNPGISNIRRRTRYPLKHLTPQLDSPTVDLGNVVKLIQTSQNRWPALPGRGPTGSSPGVSRHQEAVWQIATFLTVVRVTAHRVQRTGSPSR